MVVLPTRISDNAYAQFEIGYDYFGINLLQRTYLTGTEVDILKCKGEGIVIRPANQAVYSTEVNLCSLSLYLKRKDAREMCKRTVIAHQASPRFQRLVSLVLYYLRVTDLLHLRCQHNRSWQASTTKLEGAGLLKGVESCYLALQGLQLYPALRGEKEFSASIPILFTPAFPAAASADEMDIFRQMSFLNGTHLEELSSSLSSNHVEADVNTLIHLHASSLQRANKGYWITCGLIATGSVLVVFVIYYFIKFTFGVCLRVLLIVIAQQTVEVRNPNQVSLVLNVRIGLSHK